MPFTDPVKNGNKVLPVSSEKPCYLRDRAFLRGDLTKAIINENNNQVTMFQLVF